MNFQAYLLDGVTRWNASRSAAAVDTQTETHVRTFDIRLQDRVNHLSQSLLKSKVFPNHVSLGEYTGELIGVDYLYDISGGEVMSDEYLENQIDDGLVEFKEDAEVQSLDLTSPFQDQND